MKLIAFLGGSLVSLLSAHAADNEHAAALQRIQADIEFFADDEQEGRGVTTQGIERAAQRIIAEYEHIGLTPVMPDDSWRQAFRIKVGSIGVSDDTSLSFRSSRGTFLRTSIGSDCQAFQRGGDGKSSGGLVFLGYGISSPDDHYDEYAGLDVKGKTVIVIRRVPERASAG